MPASNSKTKRHCAPGTKPYSRPNSPCLSAHPYSPAVSDLVYPPSPALLHSASPTLVEPVNDHGYDQDDGTPDDRPGFPTFEEYKRIEANYLTCLSPRKRDKALITQAMFDKIWDVLQAPEACTIETPQFRFWVRKMFRLSHHHRQRPTHDAHRASDSPFDGGYEPDIPPVVLHENRPVAVVEQLYDLLCYCHEQAAHGGRDKTCAVIRQHYSWVPKELTAQFVKACPTCSLKRSGNVDFALLAHVAAINRDQRQDEQARETAVGPVDSAGAHGGSARAPGTKSWPPVGGPNDVRLRSPASDHDRRPDAAEYHNAHPAGPSADTAAAAAAAEHASNAAAHYYNHAVQQSLYALGWQPLHAYPAPYGAAAAAGGGAPGYFFAPPTLDINISVPLRVRRSLAHAHAHHEMLLPARKCAGEEDGEEYGDDGRYDYGPAGSSSIHESADPQQQQQQQQVHYREPAIAGMDTHIAHAAADHTSAGYHHHQSTIVPPSPWMGYGPGPSPDRSPAAYSSPTGSSPHFADIASASHSYAYPPALAPLDDALPISASLEKLHLESGAYPSPGRSVPAPPHSTPVLGGMCDSSGEGGVSFIGQGAYYAPQIDPALLAFDVGGGDADEHGYGGGSGDGDNSPSPEPPSRSVPHSRGVFSTSSALARLNAGTGGTPSPSAAATHGRDWKKDDSPVRLLAGGNSANSHARSTSVELASPPQYSSSARLKRRLVAPPPPPPPSAIAPASSSSPVHVSMSMFANGLAVPTPTRASRAPPLTPSTQGPLVGGMEHRVHDLSPSAAASKSGSGYAIRSDLAVFSASSSSVPSSLLPSPSAELDKLWAV